MDLSRGSPRTLSLGGSMWVWTCIKAPNLERSQFIEVVTEQQKCKCTGAHDYGLLSCRVSQLNEINSSQKSSLFRWVFTWHRGDFRAGPSSLRFLLEALYLFTWYHHEMSFRRVSHLRELITIVVPKRESQRKGILWTRNNYSFLCQIGLPMDWNEQRMRNES